MVHYMQIIILKILNHLIIHYLDQIINYFLKILQPNKLILYFKFSC